MRWSTALLALVALPILAACKGTSASGPVTRHQCVDLVRKEHRLRSASTGGLDTAMQVGERADVNACLNKATPAAYRCIMHAESADDLGSCEELMK